MILSPLKYPGGKSRQLGTIFPLLPNGNAGRIVEPFCGSAVVSINHPAHAKWLNDADADIILLWDLVMRDPEELVDSCKEVWSRYGNTEEGYKAARACFNRMGVSHTSRFERASLLLYLNKHSFNGLMRRNLKGDYNVPFGKMKNPSIPIGNIMAYHAVLACSETRLSSWDFEKVINECGENDIIYCDPPFAPASKTAKFTSYGVWMGEVDLMRMDVAMRRAVQRGALAVASASDTEMSHRAHKSASMSFKIEAKRSISRDGATRKPVGEVLFVYN